MNRRAICIDAPNWQAVDMRAAPNADVQLYRTAATGVGTALAYMRRADLWHGGAGIAAYRHRVAAPVRGMLATLNRARRAKCPPRRDAACAA